MARETAACVCGAGKGPLPVVPSQGRICSADGQPIPFWQKACMIFFMTLE